ncbi:DUF6153 family protein [Streptomyces sp. NPDC058662]|uniref:DUF6153 family protein n=1 Tax=Streptomyces sp. NPDC058662 TaxID=3346583 RepID=UPI003661B4C1
MISAEQPRSRRPAGRGFALLVLVVLAGVLAMHGLGPRPALRAAQPPAVGAEHGTAAAHGAAAPVAHAHGGAAPVPHAHTGAAQLGAAHGAGGDCAHRSGGTGHLQHADGTCAATGTAAPYAPPALTAGLGAAPAPPPAPGDPAAADRAGRAPPDLAELQILRI